MGKNIYDILNEIKVDLDDYDKEELSEIEKKKIKNNFKKTIKHKVKYQKAVLVVASIAILCLTMIGTDLGAYAYEGANLVFYNIANYLGIEKNLEDYTTVVNQSITKKGITVQLNEVILNNDELLASSTVTSNEKIENGDVDIASTIYINGKRISSGAGGSSKQIDEYTVEQVMSHVLDGEDLSGNLSMKIVFECTYGNEDTKKGPWVFEFKTNGDELAKSTMEVALNNTFTLEDGQNITLKKYTSNDLGQKIYYSKDTMGALYNMVLRGHDDLGNDIEFCLSSEHNGNGVFKPSTIYGDLDENAKVLSLTPYAVKMPNESGKMSNDFVETGEEFTIILTK